MTADIYQFPRKKRKPRRKAKNRKPANKTSVISLREAISIGFAIGAVVLVAVRFGHYQIGYEMGRTYQRSLDCKWGGGTMKNGVCWKSPEGSAK